MRFGDFVELKQSDIDYFTGKTKSKIKAKGRAKEVLVQDKLDNETIEKDRGQ